MKRLIMAIAALALAANVAAAWLFACIAALGLEGIRLEDL